MLDMRKDRNKDEDDVQWAFVVRTRDIKVSQMLLRRVLKADGSRRDCGAKAVHQTQEA